jgi:hypothetical protein
MSLRLYKRGGILNIISQTFIEEFGTKEELLLFFKSQLLGKNHTYKDIIFTSLNDNFYMPLGEHRELVTVYSKDEYGQKHIADYLLITSMD